MKAILIERHGGSGAMNLAEVALPRIAPDEVLVGVRAAAVNPIDWKIHERLPTDRFAPPMPLVPGRDFAGVVAATGEDVRRFAVGDRVWGAAPLTRWGSHAEFLAIAETMVGRAPAALSDIEAAAIPLAALSALAGIEAAGLAAGERILIHPGTGGTGGIAIQIARHRRAEVATTVRPGEIDHARALGADIAIDDRTTDFARAVGGCDVVFDTLGGAIDRRLFAVLRPGGRLTFLCAVRSDKTPPRSDVPMIHARVSCAHEDLERIAVMVEAGRIVPQVETILPLERAVEGYELSRTGRARGKIVLTIR